jgi:hypothetical protein
MLKRRNKEQRADAPQDCPVTVCQQQWQQQLRKHCDLLLLCYQSCAQGLESPGLNFGLHLHELKLSQDTASLESHTRPDATLQLPLRTSFAGRGVRTEALLGCVPKLVVDWSIIGGIVQSANPSALLWARLLQPGRGTTCNVDRWTSCKDRV